MTPATDSAARDYECVVVGGGAAGLSAALVLGRARRRTLVFDLDGQSNRYAAHVGGLLGLDGTPPGELYARAREQIAAYDSVVFRDAEVTDVRPDGDGFIVTADDTEVRAESLILATGMDYEVPDVPGFREHWGGQVFHCPFCHGWEVRDRKLVVYADDEAAERLVPLIGGWTNDVTLVAPADAAELRVEDGSVRAVVLSDGSEILCDAVLIHAPLQQRGGLTEALNLELTEEGLIAVDGLGHTSVPGVYAAGDAAVSPQQVAIAMGSGHKAGLVAVRELLLGRPKTSTKTTENV
jgi:thioredoxin reductase